MKLNYPTISVVTPNYNLGSYLEETIDSVLSQNYPNLEYIIVDGGSTDNSLEIIKKYEKHLTWWVSEPDDGIYDAINKGFAQSTGEIMGWLNSDDLLMPNGLWVVSELFKTHPEALWLSGTKTFRDEQSRIIFYGKTDNVSLYHLFLEKRGYGLLQQESTYWRRELWDQAGGEMNTSYKYAADYELWTRFLRFALPYLTTAAIGSFRYRTDMQQISQLSASEYLEETALCRERIYSRMPLADKIKLPIFRMLESRTVPVLRAFFGWVSNRWFDRARSKYFSSKKIS